MIALRLDRVCALLSEAQAELEDATREAPSYSIEALRFIKAEIGVVGRRLLNARRVIGCDREDGR